MGTIKVKHLECGELKSGDDGRPFIAMNRGPHMADMHFLMRQPSATQIAERLAKVLQRALELADGNFGSDEIDSFIVIAAGTHEGHPAMGILLITNDWNETEEGHELLHTLSKTN